MIRAIDNLLDRLTMYRLLLYYLIALVVIAIGLAAGGIISFSPVAIGFSALWLTVVCVVANELFARTFKAPVNVESAYLTALILALIMTPPRSLRDLAFLTLAGALAMASKYILTLNRQNLFNPAAMAAVLLALGAGQAASWWVGSTQLLLPVLVGGWLLARKLRRLRMLGLFFGVALLATAVASGGSNVWSSLQITLLHSPLFFLGFVMLIEPQTSPHTATHQRWYAGLAGLLSPPQVHLGSFYSTPELVLVISNLFSYILRPQVRLLPRLVKQDRLAPDIIQFSFKPDRPLTYQPGQYLEWTLPHRASDARGNRRIFTLASSPTEPSLQLGVKFYPRGSSFKTALRQLDGNTPIVAGQVGGDFVLPRDQAQKLVFLAGGIGITPYRSMLKYLLDRHEARQITLIYSERTAQELVYTEVFKEAARRLSSRIVYTLTDAAAVAPDWRGRTGMITAAMIKAEVPDYKERWFYVSGPQPFVDAMKTALCELEVPRRRVKTDYFVGYA